MAYSFKTLIYENTRWTGIPYILSFLYKYRKSHSLNRFTGQLVKIKESYEAGLISLEELDQRFEACMDSLVLPNGVKKTTFQKRQVNAINAFLSSKQCRIDKSAIRVLDIPSSTGVSSLDSYNRLSELYRIDKYVLADLAFNVYLDEASLSVYDENMNLLQKGFGNSFFSIYRGHVGGDVHSPLSKVVLLPFDIFAAILRNLKRRASNGGLIPIPLVHPRAEKMVKEGMFELREMNVFDQIPGKYDLILSFNLLQRNYFSESEIKKGIANLTLALNEEGYLLMGNTESFTVQQRRGESLCSIIEEGCF